MDRISQAVDIIQLLNQTGQTYIIGHDIPVSISKHAYAALETKRIKVAEEIGVPENQFEFEDLIWILSDKMTIDDYKKGKQLTKQSQPLP